MMAKTEQRMTMNAAADAADRHAPVVAPAALASAVLFVVVTGLVLLIIGRVAVPVTRACDGRRASG